MLLLYIQYHFHRFTRYFHTRRLAKIITVLLFVVVFVVVAIGIFYFIKGGLQFTLKIPYFEKVLPLYMYEMFLLTVGYLVFASSAIIGLFGLFKQVNNEWIISTPSYATVTYLIAFRVFVSSVWPFFVIATPALLAMRSVFGIDILQFILALILIFLFVAFLTFATLIILLGSAIILSILSKVRNGVLTFAHLALMTVFVLGMFAYISWDRAFGNDIVALLQAENISVEVASIVPVVNEFKIFPSHIVAMHLYEIQENNATESFALIIKMSLLLAASVLVFLLLSRKYLSLWQTLQEGNFNAKAEMALIRKRQSPFFKYFKSPMQAIFFKEILVMFRDMRSALWLGFLFLLLLIQTGLNILISSNIAEHRIDPMIFPQIVQSLQFVTLVYFISAFTMRFALPSFSTEQKTAWIIASAPVDLGKLFWSKFWFYSAIFLALGLGVSVLNFSLLGLSFASIGISIFLFAIAIIFVTTLGLALGAIFPNFDTDDPQALSTSLPGLAFTLGSLGYGAIGAVLLYNSAIIGSVVYLVWFLILSLATIAILLYKAPNAIRNIEFIRNFE